VTTEAFFKKFDQLAGAPNAVKKMRELILWSAFCGSLSPEAKNQAMPEDWTIEGVRNFSAIPTSWKWQRGCEVFRVIRGVSYKKNDAIDTEKRGYLPLLRANNIKDVINYNDLVYVPRTNIRDDQLIKVGDILIAMSSGSKKLVGKAAPIVAEFSGSFGAFCGVVRNVSTLSNDFLARYFRSPQYTAWVTAAGRGIGINNLAKGDLDSIPIPTPPLAEQKRIVAKVDELMALCDRLEAQEAERKEKGQRLARAALAQFAEKPTAANLGLVFHKSFDVEPGEIRKAILGLAVRGKLVEQDQDEEPPSSSFSGLDVLVSQEDGFDDIPPHWVTCTYKSLTSLVTSGSRGWKEYYSVSGAIFIRTQNINTDQLILDDVAFVQLPKAAEGMRTQALRDDILITITGANVTKAARIVEQIPEAYVSQHIALTRPRWSTMSQWLYLCFISPASARGHLEKLSYGDKPGLNLDNVRDLILPIPPLAEQKRIVAKVEELMALVDELEAQQERERELAERIMTAAVREMTA
jgi:type I restriction enzyme, S subunit